LNEKSACREGTPDYNTCNGFSNRVRRVGLFASLPASKASKIPINLSGEKGIDVFKADVGRGAAEVSRLPISNPRYKLDTKKVGKSKDCVALSLARPTEEAAINLS
jgi:hypothetical protein